MDSLRIWLIFLGLIIIAVIYFTGVGQDQKKTNLNLLKKRKKNDQEPVLDSPVIKPKEEEIDYTDVFRREGGLLHDKEANESSSASEKGQDKNGMVVLYVTAPAGFSFSGDILRDALYTAGMSFGAQQVFHHYGVGQSISNKSIFSAANLREPGIFDLNHMEQLNTDGLVLIMQLPAPVDASVAFEHMLSTAQRLAEILKGHVCDERREHLSPEAIELIRSYVAEF